MKKTKNTPAGAKSVSGAVPKKMTGKVPAAKKASMMGSSTRNGMSKAKDMC